MIPYFNFQFLFYFKDKIHCNGCLIYIEYTFQSGFKLFLSTSVNPTSLYAPYNSLRYILHLGSLSDTISLLASFLAETQSSIFSLSIYQYIFIELLMFLSVSGSGFHMNYRQEFRLPKLHGHKLQAVSMPKYRHLNSPEEKPSSPDRFLKYLNNKV